MKDTGDNITERIAPIDERLRAVENLLLQKNVTIMGKTPDLNGILSSSALRENGWMYTLIVAITISNLASEMTWVQILALCLSFLGIVFGGYVKKIAENKMSDILKTNKEKDEEILSLKAQNTDLKAIKEKLVEEIKQSVMALIPKPP